MFPEKMNAHSLLEMTVHGYKIKDNSSAVYGLPAHTISEYVYALFLCLLSFDSSNKDTDMRKRQKNPGI